MIFVTVGAQMPFDRLVRAVDDWAAERGRSDVFAQIGATEYRPNTIGWTRFLRPVEYRRHCEQAHAIVAHAGIGSIITALEIGRPIVVMPRRAGLRETRNDHQVATAERFCRFGGVAVAWNEREIASRLDAVEDMVAVRVVGAHASPALIASLRDFITRP